jgi:hypothetical protein
MLRKVTHCQCEEGAGRLLMTSGSPRALSPRDDKGGISTMQGVK